MFQRLDRMRKHAFGSAIVFGENNNSTISGIWIWRGHELAFEVCIVCLIIADNAITPIAINKNCWNLLVSQYISFMYSRASL